MSLCVNFSSHFTPRKSFTMTSFKLYLLYWNISLQVLRFPLWNIPQHIATDDNDTVLVYSSPMAVCKKLLSGHPPFQLTSFSHPTFLRAFRISARSNARPIPMEAMPASLFSSCETMVPWHKNEANFCQSWSLHQLQPLLWAQPLSNFLIIFNESVRKYTWEKM